MIQRFLLLITLATCICLTALGQTPAPTPAQKPNSQATSQTSPPPAINDPEVKAFVEKFNLASSLFTESDKFMTLGTPESKSVAEAKLLECIELSRNLYEKLNDKNLSEHIAQTGHTKADYQTLLKTFQSAAHMGLGNLYDVSRDYQNCIKHKKLALAIVQEILASPEMRASNIFNQLSNLLKQQELGDLEAIAVTLASNLNRPAEALEYANRSLELARRLQREDEKLSGAARISEGRILQRIGLIYLQMDERPRTISYFKQALSVYQSLPDQKHDVATLLFEIGGEYLSDVDYENALKYFDEALKTAEAIDDKAQRAIVLGSFAFIYNSLGDEAKAREFWQRQLAILVSPDYTELLKKNRLGGRGVAEANTDFPDIAAMAAKNDEFLRLLGIANTYRRLKDYDRALSNYEQALPSARSMKSLTAEQLVLSLIGNTCIEKEDWRKALTYYQQSLIVSRQLPQKSLAASDLKNIGYIHFEMKNWQEALQNANEALSLYQTLGADKGNLDTGYASTLSVIAQIQGALGNRRSAIFFGKHAVNAIQRERQQLKNLDPEARRGYLKKNEKPYRRLADWLIAEGRIAEAEQVLAMLKEEELFIYLRRADKATKELLDKIPLNDPERGAYERYEQIADEITSIAREYGELETASKQYAVGQFPQQARLDELDSKLTDARKVFNRFLVELDAQYFNKKVKQEDMRVAQISGLQALLASLKQPRTVIISTIAGEDRLNIIVTTTKINRAHTIDIKAEELNRLVAEFRAVAQNPNLDPRPAGKKLYDKLFPPALEKDLAGGNADTIIWSLDGPLRYVPVAALWDGKQYLAERYSNAVITLASRDKLKDAPGDRKNWTALGVGVSKPFGDFSALPSVPHELCSVINDTQKKAFCGKLIGGGSGIINGVNLPDEEFTLRAFKSYLGRYQVVHIASHFRLNAGNEANSFLLLGGGKDDERKLSLAAVRNEIGDKFNDVELLTLSACNTAMSVGERSSGAEIESFGALAQKQGAKAVLATLWSVADTSTRILMSEFYRQLEADPNISKSKALRKAQIALLKGEDKTGNTPLWRSHVTAVNNGNQPLPFKRDNNAPYAHPYFWSPFVLMGNWK